MRTPLIALLLSATATAQPAAPEWARFAPAQPVRVVGYGGDIMEPFVSRDGGTLFFNNRNAPPGRTDLHWATRIDDLTFRHEGLVAGANSPALDAVATMSATGRFCFISTRAYAQSFATIHCGEWRGGALHETRVQPDASVRIAGRVAFDAEIDAGGGRLIFADGLFRGGPAPVVADLRQARWQGGAFRLAPEDDALLAAVNSPALEYAAALSADGRLLAFTRLPAGPLGPRPFASASLWIARRATDAGPFGAPVRIDAARGFAEAASFAPDGAIYFHRREGGRYTLWRAAPSALP